MTRIDALEGAYDDRCRSHHDLDNTGEEQGTKYKKRDFLRKCRKLACLGKRQEKGALTRGRCDQTHRSLTMERCWDRSKG